VHDAFANRRPNSRCHACAIATQLILSEHTVHRYMANILTKLGCTSRSAAVAEALRKV
jgi:DNA-binding CsgD family transcriptional regulator